MFLGTAGIILYYTGIGMLPASKAVLLYNIAPIITAFIAYFALRERLHLVDFGAVFVSFGGVFLVTYSGDDGGS